MVALILGGGAGTRLYPLTDVRSKPAVPLVGKYRLVDIPISNCLNSGVNRMFVLTQFNSTSLNQHIKKTYGFDHFNNGFVDVLAAEQTRGNMNWFQGTADAVRQSMQHLFNHDFEHVLILSGDQLYQMDYQELLASHIATGAEISIATIPVTAEDASGFGILKMQENGQIKEFIEKPDAAELPNWTSPLSSEQTRVGKHYLASMGIYLFNRQTLLQLFSDFPAANDFGKEVIPNAILTNYQVNAFLFDDYWTDIGTIRSFMEANLALTDDIPAFNLFNEQHRIFTPATILPPAKCQHTRLHQAIVGEGSILQGATIQRAILGLRTRVESNTTVKNSIVMGADHYQTLKEIAAIKRLDEFPHLGIGKNCHIENAIIDKNCSIGNNVQIVGGDNLADVDTPQYAIRDGIIIVKKGTVLPAGTQIGKLVEEIEEEIVAETFIFEDNNVAAALNDSIGWMLD
ncbi:MAG: glucose-1-phosphate adenylyltransferase [Bacteroidota bacterium]